MSDAAELALRTLAVVAAAELVQRTLLRDARQVRRLWIATLFAIAAVALAAVVDWRPAIPSAPVRQLASMNVPLRVTEAQPPEPPHYRRHTRNDEWLFALYLLGAMSVAGVAGFSFWRLRRMQRTPVSPRISALAPCRIVLAEVPAPCTFGSTIFLPHASARWPEEKLRAAIAHELAHVRQRDSLWMLFAWLLCAACWFAPAVWIARRRLRAGCELASDACAAAGAPHAYARTLIEIAESAAMRVPFAANMAGSLSERIEWLAGPRRRTFRAAALLVIPFALAAFDWQVRLTALDVAGVHSSDPDVRARTLYRLARWQGREREVLPILLASLGDDAPLRSAPRWSYDRDGWGPARATLVHPSPGEVAAMGLASLSGPAASPLAQRLRDRDVVVRRNAAWALGELRHPRGLGSREEEALIEALQDRDAVVRAAAAWSLGDIGTAAARVPLEHMLARETDPAARREASQALLAIRQGVSSEYFRNKE
ncbi:MAG TPA: M56 family metallopeptidase [Thermoanaerobaculia bacterium]|nr:M56 family metallopeptidase [Thermoanaerobaculia bacterium]